MLHEPLLPGFKIKDSAGILVAISLYRVDDILYISSLSEDFRKQFGGFVVKVPVNRSLKVKHDGEKSEFIKQLLSTVDDIQDSLLDES